MTDQQILSLIQEGKQGSKQEKALLSLYQFYPPVKKFLINHGASDDEALDVYQDALYVLCTKVTAGNFVLTAKLSTYLFSVAKFKWKDELKKKNKNVSSEFTSAADLNFEEQEDLEFEENKSKVAEQALQTLGEKCLSILKAFYHQGKSMAEIALLFGFGSEKSAKNQKYKCLEKAKSKYSELSLVSTH